ncbi:hypothetical protein [Janibacter terrae]|uniref:hypothetical protein n=1 Tax=Janibacter terrae TaxID=103817 RepID=UPI0031F9CB47
MTAPWQRVREHLINDGVMTEQNVTRTPKPRHCLHCGRAVIAAITDLGFEVAVEPTPTTPLGELHVLLAGGATYTLLPWGEMVHRDKRRITHRDANNERVHAQHQCGNAPPEINPLFPAKRIHIEFPDQPPF